MTTLFSYVVEHDTGHAPNPYFGLCTLCRCKYRKSRGKRRNVVELAKEGDWIVGTGGANLRRSAGNGKIIYVMRVDDVKTRKDYYSLRLYARKKRGSGNYIRQQGDNERPNGEFEKYCQFVLISRHFYYFGRKAIAIPIDRFPGLEKKGPGFRKDFNDSYIKRFIRWIEEESGYAPGIYGQPCQKPSPQESEVRVCKSRWSELG